MKNIKEFTPFIPESFEHYVPFGFYSDLKKILSTKEFFPVYVYGNSGYGKSLTVTQICSELKLKMIQVNISPETDEASLIGSYSLENGNVVFNDGPVLTAMKTGSVLLLEEVDRNATNVLLSIQGIMQGIPYYNKKNGEVIHPKPGFTVIATANSRGRGSDDGKYIANVIDDAFLERFPICFYQEAPTPAIEKKILAKILNDDAVLESLIKWSKLIRMTYDTGAIFDVISTRRLVHIAKTYKIFGDIVKSIKLSTTRFDEETREAFMQYYNAIDKSSSEDSEDSE